MLEGGGNLPTAVKPYMADSSSAGVDTVSKTYKALPTSLLPPPTHTTPAVAAHHGPDHGEDTLADTLEETWLGRHPRSQ